MAPTWLRCWLRLRLRSRLLSRHGRLRLGHRPFQLAAAQAVVKGVKIKNRAVAPQPKRQREGAKVFSPPPEARQQRTFCLRFARSDTCFWWQHSRRRRRLWRGGRSELLVLPLRTFGRRCKLLASGRDSIRAGTADCRWEVEACRQMQGCGCASIAVAHPLRMHPLWMRIHCVHAIPMVSLPASTWCLCLHREFKGGGLRRALSSEKRTESSERARGSQGLPHMHPGVEQPEQRGLCLMRIDLACGKFHEAGKI